MFEQNKGASSPQANNLAGLFQNAGSFMPKEVAAPQITAPTMPTTPSPSSKGSSSVVPSGGVIPQALQALQAKPATALTPQQAAAATAARIQTRTPIAPVQTGPVPVSQMSEAQRREHYTKLLKEHQEWQRNQR